MSNPAVFKLAETVIGDQKIVIEDNIGESIHLHIGLVRIDMTVKEFVEDILSVNPQPKTGHWITLEDDFGDVVEAVCSNYNKNGNHKWMYCPNCGIRIVGDKND